MILKQSWKKDTEIQQILITEVKLKKKKGFSNHSNTLQ